MPVNPRYDLLTMGELLLRLSPPDNERLSRARTLEMQLGGAELNVAAGASLLGLNTGILSKLPSGPLGTFAENQLGAYHIGQEYLLRDTSPDARLGIYYYEYGAHPRKPGVVYDRRHSSMYRISDGEFPESLYTDARCFHTSGITLALSPEIRAAALRIIKRMKAAGTLISIDVNYRANLWSGAEAKACMEEILPLTDYFFCSEDTARLTFGKTGTLQQMQRSFASDYPLKLVVSTQRTVHSPKQHSFGSLLYHTASDSFYEEAPYTKIDVIDRIGTGDAYVGGFLYGILTDETNCIRAVEYGNAAAAAKHTIPGDLPACSLKEIDQIIADHKSGSTLEMNR